MSFMTVLTMIGKILVAVLAFGLIIFIHEFGHFIVARMCGVQVNEFAIGMGPRLFAVRGRLPKKMRRAMTDEQYEAFLAERDAYLARRKEEKKQRGRKKQEEDGEEAEPYFGTVYSVRAFPVGGFCAMEGEDADDDTADNPNAFDRTPVWQRMLMSLAGCFMNLVLGLVLLTGLAGQQELIGTNQVAVFDRNATSNAAGGLMVGDKILKVNSNRVLISNDIFYNMMRDQDGKVDFLVDRGGKEVQLRDVPFRTEEKDGVHYIQFDFKIRGVKNNVGLTLKEACLNTVCYVRQVIYTLFDLITGSIPMTALSGPVGVISAVTESVSVDLLPLLNLLALLTVNIGVFNLFPIPPLDGSLFVILLVEAVIRRPVPKKVRMVIQIIGVVLMLSLVLFVTYADIKRIFFGG